MAVCVLKFAGIMDILFIKGNMNMLIKRFLIFLSLLSACRNFRCLLILIVLKKSEMLHTRIMLKVNFEVNIDSTEVELKNRCC